MNWELAMAGSRVGEGRNYRLASAAKEAELANRILDTVTRIVGNGLEVTAADPLAQVYQLRLREILSAVSWEQKEATREHERLIAEAKAEGRF
jgi:hypothetical protein